MWKKSLKQTDAIVKTASVTTNPYAIIAPGEVPEWLNGTVSKTVVALVTTEGSNPSLSAREFFHSPR
jgi:hypothetical protein